MNYSDYRFTLDIQIHQAQVSIPVTFGDSARRLCIGLTDGRKPYVIGEGCRAVFNAKKPDGNTIKNDCIIERNVILYEFTEQTTSAEGIVHCDITLYDTEGKVLTSPQFTIVVDKRVVRDAVMIATLSESESTTLDKIISSEQAREEAEREREARDEERDEIITFFEDKGGIVISDTEPESDLASIWMKESRTDGEIYLLTDSDIAHELSDAEDKIPCVAVVNKLHNDLVDGNVIVQEAHSAELATEDSEGNNIHETYATKAEVSAQMGDIETALDSIIAEQEAIISIQNQLIGGDGV